MLSTMKAALVALLLLFTLCALTGCRTSQVADPGSGGVEPSPEPGFSSFLPSPSELAALNPPGRQSSYEASDLVLHGNQYLEYMPHHNAEKVGKSAHFTSSYAAEAGMAPSNLAYCIYDFWLDNFNEEKIVVYGWDTPPGDMGEAWVGFSYFNRNKWVWFQCSETGQNSIPGLNGYFANSDQLLVVVVVANYGESRLRYLRLGPISVEAKLYAGPTNGFAPLTTDFNASASTTEVGYLSRFEWDWNNDGLYDDNTGSTPTTQHTYSTTGSHTATVRVANSYGEQDTASINIDVLSPWTHSWGVGGRDVINAAVRDNDFSVYAVGFTDTAADWEDLLLLKFDRDGVFQWAKSWGGPAADIGKGIFISDGKLYITGHTASFGAGGHDLLLQCWTTDGQVEWSRSWGGGGRDEGRKLDIAKGMIYVVGATDSFESMIRDALLLKFDMSGEVQWARILDNANIDEGYDLEAIYNHYSFLTTIHLTGSSQDISQVVHDTLYAKFSPDGTCTSTYLWKGVASSAGNCISVSGLWSDEIYIAGTTGESGSIDLLFLEFAGGGAGVAKYWGGAGADSAHEMAMASGSYYICGTSESFGGSDDGLLLNLSAEGAVQSSKVWDRAGSNENLFALNWYTTNGMLLGGFGSGAVGEAWSNVVGSTSNATGAWSEESLTVYEPDGDSGSPSAPVVDISGGVVDTGGGGQDALLMVRPY